MVKNFKTKSIEKQGFKNRLIHRHFVDYGG
jgi:hypothetical protein